MWTSIVAVAPALPEQPEIVIVLEPVPRSGIVTSLPLVTGAQPLPGLLMVQENDVLPVWFAVSRAVAVTEKVPAAVGVPEIRPEEALIDRPAGSPVADQVYGGVPPDAESCRLTAVPTVPVWLPGLLIDGAPGAPPPGLVNSSRFGEPVPGLVILPVVALLIRPVAT